MNTLWVSRLLIWLFKIECAGYNSQLSGDELGVGS